ADHGGLELHLAIGLADGGLHRLGRVHAAGDEQRLQSVCVETIADAVVDDVGAEDLLMRLRSTGDEGGKEGSAGAATDIAGKVGDAGYLYAFLQRYADVVESADGNEDEGQRHHLEDAPFG